MSKRILVIEKCEHCPYYVDAFRGFFEEKCALGSTKPNPTGGIPADCPLPVMPERVDERKDVHDAIWCAGWNYCLSKIEKG